MHYRGKDAHFDPVFVPKGTRLIMTFHYDTACGYMGFLMVQRHTLT